MSAIFPNSTDVVDRKPGTAPTRRSFPNWLREPLLHFVLLGAALFGLDHALVSRQDDPRLIVVGSEVDEEAKRLFAAGRGRAPTADELKALRERWLDNEVLYRYGLALQVDRGDSAIRERVIFKALSVVDASVKPPVLDERVLREWFESRRAQYDEPARYDFQEAVLAGDTSEAGMRAFVEALNKGAPGDISAGLRVFKGRPHANIEQSYGAEFAKALEAAPPGGEWRAYSTRDGWRAMRLEAIVPAKPAVFETLHGVVRQDYTDAKMAEQRSAAVRALAKQYTIKYASDTGATAPRQP
ncbi:MAG TPA: peptidylprolyl isomerase [Burkholderiaceae bacterium]|nr:peptidylprolyl isomerase [Burkholderiaceae bacterium]